MAVPPPRVVSTRRLLSRPTCLFFFVSVFIPKAVRARETFFSYFALNRNGGTTDDSGRRFGCYQRDNSNLLRRLATSRHHEFLSEQRPSFLGCEAAKRAAKSREVDLSHLRGCHLRFAPNMGRSVTRIWGFRSHFRESQTSMAECIDFTPKKKQSNACVFLRHRKVKFIYFEQKLSQTKMQLSARFRS